MNSKNYTPKYIFGWLFTFFLLFVLLLFCADAKRYMTLLYNGIALWAVCVLPSSLPFLFLTSLLTKTGSVQKLSKGFTPFSKALFSLSGVSGYCLLISFLCGYPVGAKTVCDLRYNGFLSKREANKISVLASSSGPLFVLGSVGSAMFQSQKIGLILLISHYFSILLSGMVLRFYKTEPNFECLPKLNKVENVLYESMYSSVLSALFIGGFVSIFYAFSFLLEDCNLLFPLTSFLSALSVPPPIAQGVSRGLVEMTGGCATLATCPTPLSVAFCAFLITLGGLGILLQQVCFLQKAKVNLPFFFLAKFLQAILAFTIAFLLFSFF